MILLGILIGLIIGGTLSYFYIKRKIKESFLDYPKTGVIFKGLNYAKGTPNEIDFNCEIYVTILAEANKHTKVEYGEINIDTRSVLNIPGIKEYIMEYLGDWVRTSEINLYEDPKSRKTGLNKLINEL